MQENTKKSVKETDGKYLTFWTEEQLFGVSIVDVVQIIGIQTIIPVPEFPSYVKGIINLRGSIIPVIDIRARFFKPEKDYDERTCIIITNINNILTGVIVDSVNAVVDIPDDQIALPPNISQNTSNNYLRGIAKQQESVILLIEASRIISKDLLMDFANIEKLMI